MKRILLFVATFALLAFPNVNFGQAPNLGTTSGFALFTASGAFDNTGASVVTGDIGGFTYTPVGFPDPGTVVGTKYIIGDPALATAKADAGIAFGSFGANGAVLGTPLETYQTTGFILAGTYHTVGAATLGGDFTLDAEGNSNAIFVININGSLTVSAGKHILLINSASLCNVYWLIKGDFILGAGSVFRGNVISDGSITLLEGSSLLGRGITTSGAISLSNNVVTIAAGAGAAGTISGTASVCKGQTGLIYSVPAIDNASDYIWTLPVGATITAGANTNSITVSFSPTAESGNITVQGSSSCGTGTVSANFAVTLNPSAAAVAGANRAICLNTSTQIGAAAVIGNTYSWTSVPVGYTSSAANPIVTPLETTTYTVVETITATGCTNSNSVVITVNPLPAAVAGANRTICSNVTTTLGAAAVTGSTYTWSSVPAGFTSTAANPTAIPQVTTTYTVVETRTATGCINSNSVVVTVNSLPAAVAGANRTVNLNTSTQIGAVAVPGSTYSWSSVPIGFISIVANPTVTPLATTTYTVVETTTATGCINSNSVVVTVNPLLAVSVSVVADANPVSSGTSVTFTATPTNGGTAPVYQWKINGIDVGINSNTYSYIPVNTDVVTVVLTSNAVNTTGNPATSAPVTMTVNPLLAVSVSVVADANPVSSGTSVTFTATPTNGGTAPAYQWKVNGIDVGINSNTYSYIPVNNDVIKVVLTSNAVNTTGNPATSAPVTMTVNSCPSITTEPVNQTVCAGSSVSFSVAATGAGLTYQWRKGTVNLTNGGNISGANSPTLTIDPVNISDAASNYNVVVTGTVICTSNDTSTDVSLIVNPTISPNIIQPENQILCPGCPAIFSVGVTEAGLTYQWRRGTVNLVNGGNIYGATSATLIIDLVSSADVATDYNVVITGPCAPITTKNASLSLCTTTGIASLDAGNTNNAVTIYPNPFTTSIDIRINDASQLNNCELRIYNVLGEEVMNTRITKDITTLKTSNLTSGVYLFQVNSNNKIIQSGKLISKQ